MSDLTVERIALQKRHPLSTHDRRRRAAAALAWRPRRRQPVGHPDAASTAAPDSPQGDTVATRTPGATGWGPPHVPGRDHGRRRHRPLAALHQLWDGSLPVSPGSTRGWTGGDDFRPFLPTVRGPIDGVLTQMEACLA